MCGFKWWGFPATIDLVGAVTPPYGGSPSWRFLVIINYSIAARKTLTKNGGANRVTRVAFGEGE